jgi:hypothetical protein
VSRFGPWCLAVIGAAACLIAVGPLHAASFALTPSERDAAIRLGKRSVTTEDFGTEWSVAGERPGQMLMVMTPFHRLALAARNSAFREEDLRPKDVEAATKTDDGVLTLWATLKGERADFARFYVPVLMNGGQEIKATFTQNERTARREEDGSFTARCVYVFPVAGLKRDDRPTLVVKDQDAKPVAKFTMDLAAMR